ncbi:MAG: RNA polymerase-binding protein DksA [Deltaproteobacteria bacterium]|nr:RNA polymerase-binding protein DksA [Deltaproteobacteria bacterium]
MDKRKLRTYRTILNERLSVLMDASIDTVDHMGTHRAIHADPGDRAATETNRNFTLRLRDRDRRLISKIEDALRRIDDGEFGICDECGEQISEARLRARPVTTLCISCKEEAEQMEALSSSR